METNPNLVSYIIDEENEDEWTIGEYEPSEAFKKIKPHVGVCKLGDNGMIAICGSVDDKESVEQAVLFSAARELQEACYRALAHVEDDSTRNILAKALIKSGYKEMKENYERIKI